MNRRMLRELPVPWRSLAPPVALGVAAAAAAIVQWALLSRIVGGVFLRGASLAAVGLPLALFLAAGAQRALLAGAREVTAQHAATRAKSTMRARLFAHLARLGPAYCTAERTGELVNTAVAGVDRLDAYVGRYLPQVALSVLVPLLIAVAVAPADLVSAVLLLVTAPVIPLLMALVGSYAEGRIKLQWEGLSRLSAHLLDMLQGVSTLALHSQTAAEGDRVARVSERYRQRTMAVLRMAFLSGMALEFLTAAAIGVVAVTLGIRLLDGGISFERAFFVLLLTPEFYRPLRELGGARHAAMEGKAALERIGAILATPVPAAVATMPGTMTPAPLPDAPLPDAPLTIALHGVSYTYDDAPRLALDGVSFTLRPHTRTALVGPSGAGKSTLVTLLLRFIELQAGDITANGVSLADLPPARWRELVALVPQRPYLFAGSVADNLRLAKPTASDAELAWAAELAGAAEFIARLPLGYDTPVGERGARLSAGQAQRLSIARAFLKAAPLLILDEPTSSLDPESELLVRRSLETLSRERTVLMVAHRLSTAASADQIVVLDRGRVAEVGTHADLLRRAGAYARLVGAVSVSAEVEVPT